MSDPCLLIGDIGGTNARFALANSHSTGFSDELTLQCADFSTADLAIKHYLQKIGASKPDVICFAAAGPIVDQQIRLTNNSWSLAAVELSKEFSITAVRLLNDFEAIAYSIPFLTANDCLPIGQPEPVSLDRPHFMVGIVGPGTGLGAVGLRKYDELFVPITGEASHCGFAPESQTQIDILAVMRERFGRVSAERLVSGSGLENIYWALTQMHNEPYTRLSAAEIFALANSTNDHRASESVQLFFEILGQIAGDLALTLGAENGIFISGGIVKRYPQLLEKSGFRAGFENKGRHRSLMEHIPTQVIMRPQPGLLGASYCALELYRENNAN
jgi:glucokinase